jgi:hypothetical protein
LLPSSQAFITIDQSASWSTYELPKGRKQKICLFLSRVLLLGADLDGLDNHAVDPAPGSAADGTFTAAAAASAAGSSTAAAAGASTAAAGASTAAVAVREAIKTHASQIHTKDIKWGGTLLHWATEKPTMEAFIGRGTSILNPDLNPH